jgi:hypothetical protein
MVENFGQLGAPPPAILSRMSRQAKGWVVDPPGDIVEKRPTAAQPDDNVCLGLKADIVALKTANPTGSFFEH